MKKGLYNKYKVTRVDGEDDSVLYGKSARQQADYLVLKLNSNKYNNRAEIIALEAYAAAVESENLEFSKDLYKKALYYRKDMLGCYNRGWGNG